MRILIGNILFISIMVIVASRFLSITSGTPFPIAIVTSDSMSPSLMQGDIVAWTPANIEDIQIGDVVVFKSWLSWPGEKLIVHRVTDIRKMWGSPALETKGDANDYTDQAGPHIPEPYIQQKRFLGKALSIGQQPLKIPFVGYLGILATEGFDGLSQPASSKGTFTYIGVFTPLIISILLLVFSFFILPEKTKTMKEKIRFNIFEKQPLDIKRLFLFFFTMFAFLLVLAHFFAFDSIDSSIGIGEFADDSGFEFGSLGPGRTSTPRYLPIINPGIMPVKGIIFGINHMSSFVDTTTFSIEPGGSKEIGLTATAPNSTQNGTYAGDIKLYSSPVWLIFPDELMIYFMDLNAEMSVAALDIIAAFLFTLLTVTLIITAAFIDMKKNEREIDKSWRCISHIFFKRGITERFLTLKKKIKILLGKRIKWILMTNIIETDGKPIIIASALIIPLFLFLNSEILAMVISSIAIGFIAYFIKLQFRQKIVVATSAAIIFLFVFAVVKINYQLFSSDRTVIDSVALGLGAIGIYLLALSFLLLPLCLLSWYISHQIRNVKEQKDPLLILEGRCDL